MGAAELVAGRHAAGKLTQASLTAIVLSNMREKDVCC